MGNLAEMSDREKVAFLIEALRDAAFALRVRGYDKEASRYISYVREMRGEQQTRRIAMSEAKPTPGPCYADGQVVHSSAVANIAKFGDACCRSGWSGSDYATEAHKDANAELFTEALNVYHNTGLTPVELVERVKELESSHKVTLGLLQELAAYDTYQTEYDGRMYSICNDCGGQDGEHRDDCAYTRANKHIAALSMARTNTAEGDAAQTAPAAFAVAEPWWKSEDIEVTLYPPISTSGLQIGMPKGVKVMHKPTGLFATSEDERSQHQNRDVALGKLQELLATAPTPAAAKEPSP